MATLSSSTPSPRSPENEKSKRYDRQLRLWGENGQQALETSHVCLINANTVGTEILKSLVLPGIRAFTIIDDQKVTEDDYDSNFFLCANGSLGHSRAKVAAAMLLEMNDDVKKGDYVEENFEVLLDTDVHFFANFTLVIACGINSERSLHKLSNALWSINVPLLVVKSLGFLGYIRLQVREHAVIEPHPDNHLEDLRLDLIFPELHDYLNSFPTFESLSRQELSRVPSLVIIYKHLDTWRKKYNKSVDQVPANYQEKSQLVKLIKEEMEILKESKVTLTTLDGSEASGDNAPELAFELENFEEAAKMVNKVFVHSYQVPSELETLFKEVPNQITNLNKKSSTSAFWVMISALLQFTEQHQCLPVRGTIPDMNCGSAHFIKLQKIYKHKAKEDIDEMWRYVQQLAKPSAVPVSEKDVALFCRNSRYLTVVRTGPIADELTKSEELHKLAASFLQSGTDEEGAEYDELRYYLLMRLVERFFARQNRFPGQHDDEVESDISEMKREFKEFAHELHCNMIIKDELIHEICRYGGCELHSVSSFIGGCAAQEAIKLLTGQYVPIDNTFVYNGLTCTSISLKL